MKNWIIIVLALGISIGESHAAERKPTVSIVDYLKSIKADASFIARKAAYLKQWPNEQYTGSAKQNLKLLGHLLDQKKQIAIPLPTGDVASCEDFYNNRVISRALTKAFQANAVKACIVTGTKTEAVKIRKELQKLYSNSKPANGSVFTAVEHKAIHDKAYKVAGCAEDSAHIFGWYIVDYKEWPKLAIDLSIQYFGKCTVEKE